MHGDIWITRKALVVFVRHIEHHVVALASLHRESVIRLANGHRRQLGQAERIGIDILRARIHSALGMIAMQEYRYLNIYDIQTRIRRDRSAKGQRIADGNRQFTCISVQAIIRQRRIRRADGDRHTLLR